MNIFLLPPLHVIPTLNKKNKDKLHIMDRHKHDYISVY